MTTKAEEAAIKAYPVQGEWVGNQYGEWDADINSTSRKAYLQGYEQAEKDTIERVIDWLEEHFMDNSHHSGRGDFGRIDTFDFDSMEDMFNNLKKAMEDKP